MFYFHFFCITMRKRTFQKSIWYLYFCNISIMNFNVLINFQNQIALNTDKNKYVFRNLLFFNRIPNNLSVFVHKNYYYYRRYIDMTYYRLFEFGYWNPRMLNIRLMTLDKTAFNLAHYDFIICLLYC
jgi:hypothetical protein